MVKKIGAALVLAFVVGGGVFAVDWAAYPDSIAAGNFIINAGIGFGNPLYGDMVIPPLSVSVDYALPLGGLPFTLGLFGGFTTSKYQYSYAGVAYGYTYNYTGIAIAGRFAYHPNFGVKNLDVYAAMALGYYVYSAKAEYTNWENLPKPDPKDYSTLYWGFNLGARYFFTGAVGAFMELGYSALSFITAGVTFKI
jgi:tetrahydromethanopterin S-methyltransferase subunit E